MQTICSKCESNNVEIDSIDDLPTPENVQIWLGRDCLGTFYTQEKAVELNHCSLDKSSSFNSTRELSNLY